jgi:hypothetical protein
VMRGSSYFTTILTRRPTDILSTLSNLHKVYGNHTLLFCLSSDTPNLSDLVSHLTTFSDQSIGCLSAQLPVANEQDLTTCSLAFFDSRYAIPFRSIIPGRTAPRVGRWHAFGGSSCSTSSDIDSSPLDANVNWEEVWSRSVNTEPLPSELRSIRFAQALSFATLDLLSRSVCCRPHDVKSVIYLSDDAPEGLSNSLQALQNANKVGTILWLLRPSVEVSWPKLGLIASSTPFITGRPFTLFSNNNVYSSGAVGIALTDDVSKLHVGFPAGLKPFTSRLTITRYMLTLNGIKCLNQISSDLRVIWYMNSIISMPRKSY